MDMDALVITMLNKITDVRLAHLCHTIRKRVKQIISCAIGHSIGSGLGKIMLDQLPYMPTSLFILLLPETELKGAATLAERIRQTIEAHQFEDIHQITISVGVASLTTNGRDLLKRADEALYKAKEGGRNRVIVSE